MKILALDAATEALSAALLDDDGARQAREHFEIAPRAHANALLPAAERLLAEAGWRLRDVEAIAFGRGPGAFTGLRVAAGLVQGLALGLEVPVLPVSTLAALAYRCLAQNDVALVRVVQDARMGEVYTADFARGDGAPRSLNTERVIEPAAVEQIPASGGWAAAGNGWSLVLAAHAQAPDALAVRHTWPHALDIAMLAAGALARGDGLPAEQALPIYVRDDVARKPERT